MTLHIDLLDSRALNLLRGMESLNLIRLLPSAGGKTDTKLSGRFAGAQ